MLADRWGVTDAEVARAYPCDRVLASPTVSLWRGVDVTGDAWPWLVMLRVGTYSYDWVDNLGRRSPRTLLPLSDPEPGDRVMRVGTVLSADPGEQLTARVAGAVMSYVLAPGRLLLKVVADLPRPLAPALAVGDLVMARRQLLTLRDLAQRSPAAANARA